MHEQTPCDVPGTSDFAFEQAQMRRDDEIDAECDYATIHLLRERRSAIQMRRAQARARAQAAGHPSAQGLSTAEGAGGCTAAAVVDIHFAAPVCTAVEHDSEAAAPTVASADLRTPIPPQYEGTL